MGFDSDRYYDWLEESEVVSDFAHFHFEDAFQFLQQERLQEILQLRDALSVKLIKLVRGNSEQDILDEAKLFRMRFEEKFLKLITLMKSEDPGARDYYESWIQDANTIERIMLQTYQTWFVTLSRFQDCLQEPWKENHRTIAFLSRRCEVLRRYAEDNPELELLQ